MGSPEAGVGVERIRIKLRTFCWVLMPAMRGDKFPKERMGELTAVPFVENLDDLPVFRRIIKARAVMINAEVVVEKLFDFLERFHLSVREEDLGRNRCRFQEFGVNDLPLVVGEDPSVGVG